MTYRVMRVTLFELYQNVFSFYEKMMFYFSYARLSIFFSELKKG